MTTNVNLGYKVRGGNTMNNNKQDHTDHSKMDHSKMDHSKMDHSKMDHSKMDHSKMDHSKMDHSKMDHSKMDHSKMAHSSMDHGSMDHSMHGMGNLKLKFFVSLIFAIPVLLIAPMMGIVLPFQFTFEGSDTVVMILSTILFFYGGMPFIKGAKMEIEMKNPGMMTLISLGISVAYGYSMYAYLMNNIIGSHIHVMDFFWELASLIVIMLLGHWIEMNAVSNAGNALEKMAALLPKDAMVQQADGTFKSTELVNVQIDDIVQVGAGENFPVDGKIIKGSSNVNESMITGESLAVTKNEGDSVIGGSINGNGSLLVQVSGTGESGYLSQVMKLVEDAQKDQSKNERLSQVVAKYLFYIAISVGALAFVVWLLITGDLNIALERLVTVLIIACPHALGLAIPLVVARSTAIGARNGLLVTNREAFENAHKVNKVLMDKTGTLTYGDFKVHSVEALNDKFNHDQVLSYLVALEESSSHPLAIGILDYAKGLGIDGVDAKDVHTIPGVGMSGIIDGKEVLIVNEKYLIKESVFYDANHIQEIASLGNSVSFLMVDAELVGLVAQGDTIKEASYELVKELKAMGIEPVMMTGDNEFYAQAVAKKLGITEYYAQMLPEDKEQKTRELQEQGYKVMMVGDGVNDAPSLARAGVGVAVGAGTEVAIDSADIVLVKSDPQDIVQLLNLSKRTSSKMIQNLWWGAGYNFIAIPLAAGLLAFAGINLSPAVGAMLMSVSTVVVAINAMLLKMK